MDKSKRSIDISVVSGTYNRLESLRRMVTSVRTSNCKLMYEIILVDGGSTDGTLEWAKGQHDITVIEHGELLGAIKAFNDGANAANGEYVVFLNDDVTIGKDTLRVAYDHLRQHTDVGQIAFRNNIVGKGDRNRVPLSYWADYLYGQCSMTSKLLGDLAGWWGDEGMKTYGGDSRLSLRLWELGYPTIHVPGCFITDYIIEDDLRKINNPVSVGTGQHPDTKIFKKHWVGRLPIPGLWLPAPKTSLVDRFLNKTLKTLRFKGMMRPTDQMRMALINAYGAYGPAKQLNKTEAWNHFGRDRYQNWVIEEIEQFQPNLVMFQGQHHNSVQPETVLKMRKMWPDIFFMNWDGDTHYPFLAWHFEIARACHLQLIVSPTHFPEYLAHGVKNIGYWPIAIEDEYLQTPREDPPTGFDVLFTGALYGLGKFPEAEFRRDAVLKLHSMEDINFGLFGNGWQHVGLKAGHTGEMHAKNAVLHSQAKMVLSISQSAELWGYTSDRLYNITAGGVPALVQRFLGMEEHGYVDGETCIAFSTHDEMVEKVHYYLEHEEEREQIGRKGREMTIPRHTWPERIKGLISMLGGVYV